MRSDSKKRDHQATEKPAEQPTFLTDECLTRRVHQALRDAGEHVQSMIDRFGRGAKDEAWLPDAGKHRLVVLSKDDNIRRKPSEKELLKEHKVLFFALAPEPPMTSEAQVRAVMTALPEIKRMIQLQSASQGIVARIKEDGTITKQSI